MTKTCLSHHECRDPYDTRFEERWPHIFMYGKCAECHQEWCFGIANMKSIQKVMQRWDPPPEQK